VGLVPEVNASFQELTHGEFWQSHVVSDIFRFVLGAPVILLKGRTPGGCSGDVSPVHPKHACEVLRG